MNQAICMSRKIIPATKADFFVSSVMPTILLHFEGPSGSTVIQDATGIHGVTANGVAALDTTKSKFGNSSLLVGPGGFGTDGNNIDLDDGSQFAFGTSDFTIDFWVFPTNLGTGSYQYVHGGSVGDPWEFYGGFLGNITWFASGADRITTGGGVIVTGSWQHLAVVRYNANTRLYVNGSQVGNDYADINNYGVQPHDPTIGAAFGGWIDEFRILNGTAAWTSNFNPPSIPYLP